MYVVIYNLRDPAARPGDPAAFYKLALKALGYIDVTTNNTDRSSKVFLCIVIRNAGTAAAGIGTAVDIRTVCLIKYIVGFCFLI